ncbi:hypothetical protein F5X99DRAFT_415950 [Biscogniauxia marginata]|nr:hypothetical protein F5X99DRAFT_415950 [Biscogniauxia marginata]
MNILSWLEDIEPQAWSDVELRQLPKTDVARTPRGGRKALSNSDRTSSYSSTSRISPTQRLAALEIATDKPVSVVQINGADTRMPEELKTMLNGLDGFQTRVGIVPGYLAAEIKARAKKDDNFYNFHSSTFQQFDDTNVILNPKLSLDQVMGVFVAGKECVNENHPEANWNIDVRAMPCATARLIGHTRGAKMVDYCIFVEPKGMMLEKIKELQELRQHINHTDFFPLQQRPIILSAMFKKPGESIQEAQVQLGVWQAVQWALLETLLAPRSMGAQLERMTGQLAVISFLPALIVQGHEWYFAATTKSGKETLLWMKQTIGRTDTVLGIFQIIHALRYIAVRAVLQIPDNDLSGYMDVQR